MRQIPIFLSVISAKTCSLLQDLLAPMNLKKKSFNQLALRYNSSPNHLLLQRDLYISLQKLVLDQVSARLDGWTQMPHHSVWIWWLSGLGIEGQTGMQYKNKFSETSTDWGEPHSYTGGGASTRNEGSSPQTEHTVRATNRGDNWGIFPGPLFVGVSRVSQGAP